MKSSQEVKDRNKKIASLKDSGYSTQEIYDMGFKNKFGKPISKRHIQKCIQEYSKIDFSGRITDSKILSLRDLEIILKNPNKKDKIVKKRLKEHYKKTNAIHLKKEPKDKLSYRNKLRATVFDRDNYECSKCKSSIGLEAHHTLLKDYEDFEKEVDNCITLCYKCHRKLHY